MKIYLGIDWDTKQLIGFWKTNNSQMKKIVFKTPTLRGVKEQIEYIRAKTSEDAEIVAIIESGASQWNTLLHLAGVKLHIVNPKQSVQFRESLQNGRAKDDARDAKALLAMAQSPYHISLLPRFSPPTEELTKIEILIKLHEKTSKRQVQLQQQLRDLLLKFIPCLYHYVQDIDATWILHLLSKVSSKWKLSTLTKAKFEKIISQTRFRQHKREELWKILEESKLPTASKELDTIETMQMSFLIEEIQLYNLRLKELESQMDQVIQELEPAKSLSQIRGIGRICTLVLMYHSSTLVPIHRDSLSIKMGASPVFIGSGSTRKGEVKGYVSRRTNISNRSKSLTYMIGLHLMKESRWAKAMFIDGRERGQRTGTIFRRITRSFLRIVSSILKNGTEYDEERYLKTLIKKGIPWAQPLSEQLSS